MLKWRDEGTILTARPHGESKSILEILTSRRGLHAGVLHGGSSKRLAAVIQPGAQVAVEWRARLEEHIGSFRVEPLRSRATAILGNGMALAALASACALLSRSLPEREPNPALYDATTAMLDRLGSDKGWLADYLRWELRLLKEIGFALDLSACAATGTTDDLRYVSPKSGRAVSGSGAGQWADRLLPLPKCFGDGVFRSHAEISDGLRTTGHFLEKCIAARGNSPAVPAARVRFAETVERAAAKEEPGSLRPRPQGRKADNPPDPQPPTKGNGGFVS